MVIYKCDLCKKICENEVMKIQLPINKYMYVTNKEKVKLAKFKSHVEVSNIEICPTCAIHIADFLDSLCISS